MLHFLMSMSNMCCFICMHQHHHIHYFNDYVHVCPMSFLVHFSLRLIENIIDLSLATVFYVYDSCSGHLDFLSFFLFLVLSSIPWLHIAWLLPLSKLVTCLAFGISFFVLIYLWTVTVYAIWQNTSPALGSPSVCSITDSSSWQIFRWSSSRQRFHASLLLVLFQSGQSDRENINHLFIKLIVSGEESTLPTISSLWSSVDEFSTILHRERKWETPTRQPECRIRVLLFTAASD